MVLGCYAFYEPNQSQLISGSIHKQDPPKFPASALMMQSSAAVQRAIQQSAFFLPEPSAHPSCDDTALTAVIETLTSNEN
jgi:hypothetical protein